MLDAHEARRAPSVVRLKRGISSAASKLIIAIETSSSTIVKPSESLLPSTLAIDWYPISGTTLSPESASRKSLLSALKAGICK